MVDAAILKRPFIRYLFVGGSVYLLELIVIAVALKAGQSNVAAVAWAFWTGLIVSFGLQKFVTFSDKRTHHRVVAKQFAAVAALVFFNFIFTVLVTKLTEEVVPAVVSRTIALLITTLWNFYLYRTSIFRGSVEPIY